MARSFSTVVAIVAVTLGPTFVAPAFAIVPSLKQPTWLELTAEQKQILAPLAGEWDGLEAWRRKKWIGIAQRYPAMNSEEQARIQRRMIDWVKLSPDERKAAREKYKHLQKAPPEDKEAIKQKWQEYKQLPEDERQRLKEEAAKAKPLPKPGRAAAPAAAVAAPKPAEAPAAVAAQPAPPTESAPQAQQQ